ncbi:MAG: ferredoxin, partial [Myxococcota bacterium]
MRVARLEIAGSYRPEVHDAALADLQWEGFTPAELAHTPAVLVVASGGALRRRHQGELTALLRSSRPVGLLVQDCVAAPDEASDLSRYHAGLGYLAVAHREALVLQTGWGQHDALVDGLARMAHAHRPAVALFVTPSADPPGWASLEAAAALAGRAAPELLYDPDAGSSWAERLTLGANPAPGEPWPTYELEVEGPEGEETLELPLTWADVVALEPTYAPHLRMIPPEAWSDEQVPLAEYLDRFDPAHPEPLVPFILVLDGKGGVQRAVVSRALALATLDRLRAWRVLQELAGHANEFARRAADAAREDARREAEAKLEEARAAFEAELEQVRNDTARESIDRLASALLDMDVASAANLLSGGGAPARAAAAPAPSAPAEAEAPAEEAAEPAEAEAPAEEEEEEELSLDEPFIDTALCTTCNECINLNGQLFVYNADKQAELGDLSAGTFEDLVKAAEACPAACIHPGKPRPDDSTATPELIERAKAFA